MTAAPGNPTEKAKQGHPQALAALIGRSMKPQGIDVDVTREDSTIHIWLKADKVPNPQAVVAFIRKGMTSLGIRNIDTVKVYGTPRDAETPLWQEEFSLTPLTPPQTRSPKTPPPPEVPAETVAADEPLIAEDSLPDDLLDDSEFPEELMEEDPIPLPDEEFPMDNEDDMDVESQEFEEEDDEEIEDDSGESTPKSKAILSPVLLGLLLLVAVGGVGYFFWPQIQAYLPPLPFIGGGGEEEPAAIPEATEDTATGEAPAAAPPAGETPETATPEATPVPETAVPEATPSPDPFRDAVQSATQAAQLTQTAQTAEEWQAIADLWQQAADSMKAVPEGHQGYDIAQEKIEQYENNVEYARKAGQLN